MFKYVTISKFPMELYKQAKQYSLDKGVTLRQLFIDAVTKHVNK